MASPVRLVSRCVSDGCFRGWVDRGVRPCDISASSVDAIVSLPLLNVEVGVLRALLKAPVVSRLRLDLPAHEWRELFLKG